MATTSGPAPGARRVGLTAIACGLALTAAACAPTGADPEDARVAALVVEADQPTPTVGAPATTATPTDDAGSEQSTTSTTAAAEAPPATIDPAVLAQPRADPNAPGWLPVAPDEDMPNPKIVFDDETDHYVLFATQNDFFGELLNVPWRVSPDLVRWHHPGDALPVLPAWAEPGATWAPEVMEVDGGLVLYFTARIANWFRDVKCIGHAVSTSLTGPYEPFEEPIVCQIDRGGSIDPRTFVDDDGSRWLLWKSDDNSDLSRRNPTSLYVQQLSDDGVALVGEPTVLLDAEFGWEGHIVEAPDLVRGPDGRLWLFFSGGWFNQPTYGLGVAECESVTGPCRRHRADRFLGSNAQGQGPGEASIFTDLDGSIWLAYSPWAQNGPRSTPRPLALARLGFDDDGPYLADPGR